nr:beta-hydroxyacyl-ACP dehydratase [uncultured Oscillibacter sp.]
MLTYNHEQVMSVIPQRDPILLIDEVQALEPGSSITASFFVRPDMAVFQGHFPEEPILPGVYTVESAAQAASLLFLSVDRYAGKLPLFCGIDNVRFLKKVKPGDTITLKGKSLSEYPEKAIVKTHVEVFNGGEPAALVDVTLAIR